MLIQNLGGQTKYYSIFPFGKLGNKCYEKHMTWKRVTCNCLLWSKAGDFMPKYGLHISSCKSGDPEFLGKM